MARNPAPKSRSRRSKRDEELASAVSASVMKLPREKVEILARWLADDDETEGRLRRITVRRAQWEALGAFGVSVPLAYDDDEWDAIERKAMAKINGYNLQVHGNGDGTYSMETFGDMSMSFEAWPGICEHLASDAVEAMDRGEYGGKSPVEKGKFLEEKGEQMAMIMTDSLIKEIKKVSPKNPEPPTVFRTS